MSLHSTAAPDSARFIDTAQLDRLSAHLGSDYETRVTDASPPLDGRFGVETLTGGLVLRHASVRNRQDMCARAQLRPGLKLIIVLDGEVDIRFGGRALPVAADGPCAYALHLHENTAFERRARANTHEQSLTLTVPYAWLRARLVDHDASRNGARLIEAPHLSLQPWQPGAALIASARSLVVSESVGLAHRLQCESLALAIVADALPVLLDNPTTDALPKPIDARRLRRMRELVDRPASALLSVDALAREAGMSRSSLQRHFRICYGMSVQKFMRARRLQAADRALREDGASVAHAAELAGYSSAANFATAYRRVYGIAPSERSQRGAAPTP
ncbi:AraC family transcription regulator [Salinisphaera sp. S4-8]|uniref:helix-turn-helix transcriptional regulator n=1 Tax=Salinisphaera sp. S4-8 TaxID=633357 RepID=UPI003342091C